MRRSRYRPISVDATRQAAYLSHEVGALGVSQRDLPQRHNTRRQSSKDETPSQPAEPPRCQAAAIAKLLELRGAARRGCCAARCAKLRCEADRRDAARR
jgi:hypothetical protein